MGVETGGCPHTAIREDASINLEAIDRMLVEYPDADIVFVESGGDNLAATFSPELSDLTLYVIDVAGGEKIPRKGGPGITRSDLLITTRPTSRRTWAPTCRSWPRTRSASAASARSSSPICAAGKAWR